MPSSDFEMSTTLLPPSWPSSPQAFHSLGTERDLASLIAADMPPFDTTQAGVIIAPFSWDGVTVTVDTGRLYPSALHTLAWRFQLPSDAIITPQGLRAQLLPSMPSAAGTSRRFALLLYFQSSHETIDWCLQGTLAPKDAHTWTFQVQSSEFVGPFFHRNLNPFTRNMWQALDALQTAATEEETRHRHATAMILQQRAELYQQHWVVDDTSDHNRLLKAPLDYRSPKIVPGTLWVTAHDAVALVIRAGIVRHHHLGGRSPGWAELLFPDGRRQLRPLYLERWTPLPIWSRITRPVVLDARLYRQRGSWEEARITGSGHFPYRGRHDNPWSFPVRLSAYKYAVRLAAAVGWATPTMSVVDFDGTALPDPCPLHVGQWVRLPYRRTLRWALICAIDDPDIYLRDTEERLIHTTVEAVFAHNTTGWPTWLAGPVQSGIPDDPQLVWDATPPLSTPPELPRDPERVSPQ